jgi:hypothetical protein
MMTARYSYYKVRRPYPFSRKKNLFCFISSLVNALQIAVDPFFSLFAFGIFHKICKRCVNTRRGSFSSREGRNKKIK